ncbi:MULTISPECIES: ribosomal protein S18-alanine N-acetyltransferase [Anaerofustis]|uniref:ribosomal protein S18-alanine N-acetyltransferase n=1 Tax=Anaerofustis TaxID=264995 RepID=UPI001106813C|nr:MULTISPECIES: ribosomal protein S18-alanine N-acetyltransferase [Anaerofustis]MCO8194508.1 ribosomal protein S18-alanine N-acetyltransferase [Anaerofustis sp. NSJ-163]
MSILVREAVITDIEDIIEFEKGCFANPWSDNSIFSELINDKSYYIVFYDKDELIAFGGYQDIVGQGHITTMGIKENRRGKGYGKDLLLILIKHALKKGINEMTLEVRESNEPAINLYESAGFKIYGKRKNYYADNHEDAYIMWRFEE